MIFLSGIHVMSEFMPHGHCYFWDPYVLWSHALADGIIALAYCCIPVSLIYIFRRRKDFTFIWMMILFSIFIFGCGVTHMFDVITIWNPVYRADSLIRIITAAASVGTAIVLVRITPSILRIPSAQAWVEINEELHATNQQLVTTNEELQAAIEELRLTNEKLAEANQELDWTNHQLSRTNQELDRSNQELERFAAVASHDLQEPLRKVKSFGGLLIKEYAPLLEGNGRLYLQRMESSVSRMQQLIDDLLRYSKITRPENDFAYTDLNEVMAKVTDELEIKIQETHAQIQVEPLPAVWGISWQLGQVISNLITNALKFTKPQVPPLIHIRSRKATAEDVWLQGLDPLRTFILLTVADNGIGFDPHYAENIFDLFSRLHSRQEYEGSGLGLSICRRIIENHAGKIFATSQEGQGAIFTLLLPVTPPLEKNI